MDMMQKVSRRLGLDTHQTVVYTKHDGLEVLRRYNRVVCINDTGYQRVCYSAREVREFYMQLWFAF